MIEINENFSLKEYNTFGIDVTCKYFVKCDQESELLEFVGSYELDPEEILLLGGGSNFLFTENFDGVVFYPVMQGCEIVREDDKYVFVRDQPRLPRMVLISPLCASRRKGCASPQVGKVLVLKRECTNASPLVK